MEMIDDDDDEDGVDEMTQQMQQASLNQQQRVTAMAPEPTEPEEEPALVKVDFPEGSGIYYNECENTGRIYTLKGEYYGEWNRKCDKIINKISLVWPLGAPKSEVHEFYYVINPPPSGEFQTVKLCEMDTDEEAGTYHLAGHRKGGWSWKSKKRSGFVWDAEQGKPVRKKPAAKQMPGSK